MSRSPTPVTDSIVYDSELNAYVARYDEAYIRPSQAVVEVLAAIADRELTDLVPLYEVVDPDALDDLLANGTKRGDRQVTFTYRDHDVTTQSHGRIVVRLRSEDASETSH